MFNETGLVGVDGVLVRARLGASLNCARPKASLISHSSHVQQLYCFHRCVHISLQSGLGEVVRTVGRLARCAKYFGNRKGGGQSTKLLPSNSCWRSCSCENSCRGGRGSWHDPSLGNHSNLHQRRRLFSQGIYTSTQRKYVLYDTSVGQCSSPCPSKLGESRNKILPRVSFRYLVQNLDCNQGIETTYQYVTRMCRVSGPQVSTSTNKKTSDENCLEFIIFLSYTRDLKSMWQQSVLGNCIFVLARFSCQEG